MRKIIARKEDIPTAVLCLLLIIAETIFIVFIGHNLLSKEEFITFLKDGFDFTSVFYK